MSTTVLRTDNDAARVAALVELLGNLIGTGHVLVDDPSRIFYSTDIFTEAAIAAIVVQPGSAEDLAHVVRLCTAAGFAVIPRGGGFSYSGGYVPTAADSVMIDTRRMNSVIEVNAEDMYVTVECGCTWKKLYDAVTAVGCRTPYFGPNSGYHATVGGAVSQGSFFLGSTQYGTTADTVLGLRMVLGDGTLVHTGSAATKANGNPFFRNYGPDLTGLFLHDSGALGFKAEVTLKLIHMPEHVRYFSFAVKDDAAAISAMSEIARRGIASECYLWDRVFVEGVRKRSTILEGLKVLGAFTRSSRSLFGGLCDAAKMAVAGRSVFDQGTSLLHVVIDEITKEGADAKALMVEAIVEKLDAISIEPTMPRASHGAPFSDFLPYETANARTRRLPTNALYSHSNAPRAFAALNVYLESRRAELAASGVTWGCISFAVGNTAICIEPCFYWEDDRLALADRMIDKTDPAIQASTPIPAARKIVDLLRRDISLMQAEYGAAHVQIGRDFPYRETRRPESFALLQAIKQAIDPVGLVNPGALGLSAS